MTKREEMLNASQYLRIVTKAMLDGKDIRDAPTDRQQKVPGFSQESARKTGVYSCGAGGLFAEQGVGLVRKGYGRVGCADMDFFDPTNFPRQLCYAEDLYQNKALAVAKNLAREALLETVIEGYAMPYVDAREYVDWDEYDILLCNVDNDAARVAVSLDARLGGRPAVFSAVSADAGNGYVFVQETTEDAPCLACARPSIVGNKRQPCPGTPACRDILTVVAGWVLYAIDTLVMERKRYWNMYSVFMDGSIEDAAVMVKKNPGCPLCGAGAQK